MQPKVPLVQSGSMELKIVAQRAAGFKAPITLHMLYNPPGVSTPSTVTIPEGHSEVLMPLTADGGAAVRKWKIAVVGEATVGDGAVLVSSQLADLEVAPPFVQFTFPTVTVDQAQQADLVVKVEKKKDFAGAAKVELLGLPNEVTRPRRGSSPRTRPSPVPDQDHGELAGGPAQEPPMPGGDRRRRGADYPHAWHGRAADPEAAAPEACGGEPSRSRLRRKPQPQAAPKVLSRLEQLRQERKQAAPAEKK